MAAMVEAVSPDEHHRVLEAYAGSWNHALKFYPAPDAEPVEMTATSVGEMTMGGRYLVSDYDGAFLGAPFEGRETLGYDKVKGKYFSREDARAGGDRIQSAVRQSRSCGEEHDAATGRWLDPLRELGTGT